MGSVMEVKKKNKRERSEWRRIDKEKIGGFPDQVVTMKKSYDLPPSVSSCSCSCSSLSALDRAVGNSFFKIMIANYKEIMHIPPAFARTVGFLKHQNVYLGDSRGHTWRVKVAAVGGSLAFHEGWRQFVLDQSITVGEFIIFKYLGGSLFRARVYGTHACDRTFLHKKKMKKNPRPAHESFHFPNKQNTPIPAHYERQKDPMLLPECSHFHKKQKTHEAVKDGCIPSNGAIAKKLRGARLHNKSYVSANNMTDYGRTRPSNDVPTKEKSYFTKVRKTAEVWNDQHITSTGERKKFTSAEMYGAGITECKRPRGRPRKVPHKSNEPKSDRNVNEAANPTPLEAKFCSDRKPINVESTKTSVRCLDSEAKKAAKADFSLEQEVIAGHELSKSSDANKNCTESGENLTAPNESQNILVTEDGVCHVEEINREIPPIECLGTRKEAMEKRHKAKQEKIRLTNVENDRDRPMKQVRTSLLYSADHDRCASQRNSPQLGSVSYGYNEERKTTSKQKAIVPVQTEGIISCDALSAVPSNISFFITSSAQSSWTALPEKLSCQLRRMKANKKVIILRDSSMNIWPVVYHYSAKFIGFAGGWEDFMTANDLCQGDLCELEPIEGPECMFQVHIHKTT